MKQTPNITNPHTDITVFACKNGQWERGIFHGYSGLSQRYHVSFFNGDNGRYSTITSILFDETSDGSPPDRAIGLICHEL